MQKPHLVLMSAVAIIFVLIMTPFLTYAQTTADSVFTNLKSNDALLKESIITIANPESSLPKEALTLTFKEDCGKVISYQILELSVCEKTIQESTTIKVCDTIIDNKTSEKRDVCTDKISYIPKIITEPCYVPIKEITSGIKDYKIKADIHWANCKDETRGYKIDWIPSLQLSTSKLSMDSWAWWNISYSHKRLINCSNINETSLPILINGSFGFQGNDSLYDGVWANCQPNLYLYYNNGNDYVIANDTERVPTAIEVGDGVEYERDRIGDNNIITFTFANGTTILVDVKSKFNGTNYSTSTSVTSNNVDKGMSGSNYWLFDNLGLATKSFTIETIVKMNSLPAIRQDGWSYGTASAGIQWGVTYDNRSTYQAVYPFINGYSTPFYGGALSSSGLFMEAFRLTYNGTVWASSGNNNGANYLYNQNGNSKLNTIGANGGGLDLRDNTNYCFGCARSGSQWQNQIFMFRVSNVTRSDAWVNQTVYNQQSLSGYGNLEAEENVSLASNLIIISNSPINNSVIFNSTLLTVNFTATDDLYNNLTCNLIINNSLRGINSAVQNNTQTNITSNSSLTGGTIYEWKINCSDGITTNNVSETRLVIFPDCNEDWNSESPLHTNCTINDTDTIYYIDQNGCGTTYFLPEDNNTAGECNYCSEDLVYGETDCIDGTQTISWSDNNFINCCYVTGIITDCSILYPPYNGGETRVNCTGQNESQMPRYCNITYSNFTCEYDPIPILNKKLNVVCQMPDGDDYRCVVNIYQNQTLLASTPEYKESTSSLLQLRPEGDTRQYFTPQRRLLNAEYTPKNLRTDTEFTMEVYCSSENKTIRSQYCIMPTYDKPDWILNRIVWVKGNTAPMLLIIGLVIVFIAIMIYYWRKTK